MALKIKPIWIQGLLFLFFGGVCFFIDVISFFLFLKYVPLFSPLISAICSTLIATVISFVISLKLIFAPPERHFLGHIFRFAIVVSLGLLCNAACFWFFSEFTALSLGWSKIVAIFFAILWNFWARRVFVFSGDLPPITQNLIRKYQSKWFSPT